MVNVPATEDIATGDTVVTAGGFGKGFGSQFPKDIVIGRIIEVRKDPASIVITALVQPAADLDSLESVLVITDFVPRAAAGGDARAQPRAVTGPQRDARADPEAEEDAQALAASRGPAHHPRTTRAPAQYPGPAGVRVGASAPDRTRPHSSATIGGPERALRGCQARTTGAPWGHPTRDHAGMDTVAAHKRACVQ